MTASAADAAVAQAALGQEELASLKDIKIRFIDICSRVPVSVRCSISHLD